MSEHSAPQPESDDTFDAMMSAFEADRDYIDRLSSINDEIDQALLSDMFTEQDAIDNNRGAYYRASIDEELNQVATGIDKFCQQIGVTFTNLQCSEYEFAQIIDQIALEVYTIQHALKPGDIISAINALIIDMEEGDSVQIVPEGARIQGEFVNIILGYIPDDAMLLTIETSNDNDEEKALDPPLGIGLLLRDVVITDPTGLSERYSHPDSKVVMALGTVGLRVDKHYYQSEEVTTTDPDGTSTNNLE